MARSLKKGPYVHYSLEKKIQQNIESGKKNVINPYISQRIWWDIN